MDTSLVSSPDPTDRRTRRRPTGASLVALLAGAICVGGMLLLHVERGDISAVADVMSHYANGPDGGVMSIVFFAFGVALAAVGLRLCDGIDRAGLTRIIPGLLLAAGACMVAAGVWEVDPPDASQTFGDFVHSDTAVAGFVLTIVAMVLFGFACRRDARWRSLRGPAIALALVAGVFGVANRVLSDAGWGGLAQRVTAGAVIVWVAMVSVRVRSRWFA
jgi:hypothetical protein